MVPLNPQTLAADEGLVDGLNAGVMRVRTKNDLLRVPLQDAKVLAADGGELVGREIILCAAKRGTRLKLAFSDGKVTTLQVLRACHELLPQSRLCGSGVME